LSSHVARVWLVLRSEHKAAEQEEKSEKGSSQQAGTNSSPHEPRGLIDFRRCADGASMQA
jgi:hypothetical protein